MNKHKLGLVFIFLAVAALIGFTAHAAGGATLGIFSGALFLVFSIGAAFADGAL